MFDFGVGYTEMFLIAVVAVIVIGPKDLPKVLRAFGKTVGKMRAMAREFQGHLDGAIREAGLEDVKKEIQGLKTVGTIEPATKKPAAPPSNDFEKFFGPTQSAAKAPADSRMTQQDIDASEAPLIEHLIELRKRLMYCVYGFVAAFVVSFWFSSDILHILVLPFKWGTGTADVRLISIKLLGVFLVKIKIAFFGGLFIAFPLIAIQIYKFVAPGLYSNERNAFRPYLMATPVFFVLGAALVYFFLLPTAIHFFYALAAGTGGDGQSAIDLLPDIESYLDFVMMLILAFGLCFQLPVVLTLLGQIGIVNYQQLKSGRKFAVVGVFILAAILTPPDPISQISMAVPLMALYEISVQAVRFLENRRKKRDAARELQA